MDEQHTQQLYDQPYAESYDAKFLMSVIDKLNNEHELSLLRGFLRPSMVIGKTPRNLAERDATKRRFESFSSQGYRSMAAVPNVLPKIISLKLRLDGLISPTRLWSWWEFKTPVFLGVAYLVGLATMQSFALVWPALVKVIVALIPVASFVCVINDITDAEEDQRAGKSNTMAGRSALFKATWVFLCLSGGMAGCWMLADRPTALALYLANWLAFGFYSIPPIRLKTRGVWGVLADASGGQLLPTLWVAFTVAPLSAGSLSPALVAILGLWSFSLGLRGILAHQAADLANDQKSETKTLIVRWGADAVKMAVRYGVFPLEVISLGLLLLQVSSPIAWVITGLFLMGQVILARQKEISFVLVVPQERCQFVLFRYYITVFPLCFVPAMVHQSLWALLLIPTHLILFPGCWGVSLKSLSR